MQQSPFSSHNPPIHLETTTRHSNFRVSSSRSARNVPQPQHAQVLYVYTPYTFLHINILYTRAHAANLSLSHQQLVWMFYNTFTTIHAILVFSHQQSLHHVRSSLIRWTFLSIFFSFLHPYPQNVDTKPSSSIISIIICRAYISSVLHKPYQIRAYITIHLH